MRLSILFWGVMRRGEVPHYADGLCALEECLRHLAMGGGGDGGDHWGGEADDFGDGVGGEVGDPDVAGAVDG